MQKSVLVLSPINDRIREFYSIALIKAEAILINKLLFLAVYVCSI
jgi:hypothetical protein